MNGQLKNKEKGFTIIEVVLVLAIAGLIFLMVFIALPALQRNQRDTQRKNDMSRVITALTSYQSNNRQALPASTSAAYALFLTNYLRAGGDTFQDPSSGNYKFVPKAIVRTAPTVALSTTPEIWQYDKSTCSGESIIAAGSNKVAFAAKLEGGGVACVNN
ncbi:MAG: type II secretion system protein [Candidatus Saccharimonadales bacterium]